MNNILQNSSEKIYVYIFLILLFFEQLIVRFLDFQGMSVIIFFLFVALTSFNQFKIQSLLFFMIFVTFCYVHYLFTPCEKGYDFILSSILLGLILYCNLFFNVFNVFKNEFILKIFLFVISIFITIQFFTKFNFLNIILGHSENIFLFNEQSHYALYILPLLFFIIFKNGLSILNLFFLSGPLGFFSSATFHISFLLYFFTKTRIISSFFIIICLFSLLFFNELESFFSQTQATDEIHLLTVKFRQLTSMIFIEDFEDFREKFRIQTSVAVFLNGYSTAFNNLLNTNFVGLGLNQMGCNKEFGFFAWDIKRNTGGYMLNQFDGSFLASKIISEFGLLGLVFCIYIFLKCIFNIAFLSTSKDIENVEKLIFLSLAIFVFITFFVRSAGGYNNLWILFIVGFLSNQKKYRS